MLNHHYFGSLWIASLARSPAAVVLVLLAWGATARAEHLTPTYCATGIPTDEATGWVPFPRGDVFCPLIADPKADGSFVSYLRGDSTSAFGTDIGAVGVGDRFGLFRWGGPRPGEGLQVSLVGSVFAQFDLTTSSFDLVNADYRIGLPVTFRWNRFSTRIRLYHQSSHLGDEFLLRTGIVRENFAFESLEGIMSVDAGPLRAYAGGEYLFNLRPEEPVARLAHGGVELRQGRPLLEAGDLMSVRLVAGADVQALDRLDWDPAFSVRAGLEVGRPREAERPSRRWSILAEYYDGPSHYGQFFREHIHTFGVGMHFTP